MMGSWPLPISLYNGCVAFGVRAEQVGRSGDANLVVIDDDNVCDDSDNDDGDNDDGDNDDGDGGYDYDACLTW